MGEPKIEIIHGFVEVRTNTEKGKGDWRLFDNIIHHINFDTEMYHLKKVSQNRGIKSG